MLKFILPGLNGGVGDGFERVEADNCMGCCFSSNQSKEFSANDEELLI